jgi:hypothetical protein
LKKYVYLILITIFIGVLAGCSNRATSPELPTMNPDEYMIPVSQVDYGQVNRNYLGSWIVEFDLENRTVKVDPVRDAFTHLNVTGLIPAPVIVIKSFDPVSGIVDVDFTISNPYPVTVYDTRVIIFTDNVGHMLLNSDDWTSLYDIAGGLPINPFKAFAKGQPNHRFVGPSQLTENLQVLLPGGNPSVRFTLDASYPANCEEPFSIGNFQHGDLTETVGSSAQAQVDVSDWQNDTNSVFLYCPVITGTSLVPFTQQTLATWIINIVNNTGASAGIYDAFIMANSQNSGSLALYDSVKIEILEQGDTGWARTWGGDTSSDFASVMGVTVDEAHNTVWIVGGFSGTVDFNPGTGVKEFSSTAGDVFAFVCRYNLEGNFQNAFAFGDGADEYYFQAIRIAHDSYGDVYVCGNYWGTVDFNPGPSQTIKSSKGNYDFFVARYSPAGSLYWVLSSGGADRDYCFSVAVDDSDQIYVGGTFESTMDFDPGSGVAQKSPLGYSDTFIVSYNRAGTYQWANTFGGGYSSYCISLDTFNNHVYSTGYFDSMVDFDPGSGVVEKWPSGYIDCYLLEYDNSGNYVNVNTWGGGWSETEGYSVGIDSSGNAFVHGRYDDSVDFDPGSGEDIKNPDTDGEGFICKYNSNGTYQWVRTLPLKFQPMSIDKEMAVSDDSYVYLTGEFKSTTDFDPSPDVYELTPVGSYDFYLVKLDTNGDFDWARSWGASSVDASTNIGADSSNNSYTVGTFYNTVDFDPGSGVDEHSSGNGTDSFLLKVNTNGLWD